jgi:sulfur-carrier protein
MLQKWWIMEIILFGQLADIVGSATWETETLSDTDTLRHSMEQYFPGLSSIKYFIAVNKQVVQKNTLLNGDETIALMPPFSGG